jgi:cytochrome c oxidase assembly factor CtaG
LATIWLALDWPLGALAGYLTSAHTGQLILLSLVAAPLLLLGLAPRLATLADRRWIRIAAHPLTAFAGYNLILMVTHIPAVIDGLMPFQWGSFLIDLAWLVMGGFLWWPVIAPAPIRRLTPPLQMLYLFIQTIPAIFPAAFLTFADYPLYRLYELAPRVTPTLTPWYDHQLAGLLMKVVGDPLVWVGIAIIFFRWANAERRADLARSRGLG